MTSLARVQLLLSFHFIVLSESDYVGHAGPLCLLAKDIYASSISPPMPPIQLPSKSITPPMPSFDHTLRGAVCPSLSPLSSQRNDGHLWVYSIREIFQTPLGAALFQYQHKD
ncbi:BgtTE-56003 [Blumeria graminis f. sp. tritici]|uniref:BgtTE-56003 n=1 Tax=Blumeria graminis f. sp. tritici TaxID=62690 RepID=A0A9X9L7N1_BLUGR|nr:BgtTE-56003 [Blumeria graminis f. sp. tritici]